MHICGHHQPQVQGHLCGGSQGSEGREDKGCRTLGSVSLPGWARGSQLWCGSVGTTDWWEISAAFKSAKQQTPSFPFSASEATGPTGHGQLQRPKAEDHGSWTRSSPGVCHPSPDGGGHQEDEQVQGFLRRGVAPEWSCPAGQARLSLGRGTSPVAIRSQSDSSGEEPAHF